MSSIQDDAKMAVHRLQWEKLKPRGVIILSPKKAQVKFLVDQTMRRRKEFTFQIEAGKTERKIRKHCAIEKEILDTMLMGHLHHMNNTFAVIASPDFASRYLCHHELIDTTELDKVATMFELSMSGGITPTAFVVNYLQKAFYLLMDYVAQVNKLDPLAACPMPGYAIVDDNENNEEQERLRLLYNALWKLVMHD